MLDFAPDSPLFDKAVDRLKSDYPDVDESRIRKLLSEAVQEGISEIEGADLSKVVALQSHHEHLQSCERAGIWGVMCISQRDDEVCEACWKRDGNVYTLEYALEHDPLPHPSCTNAECRCSYLPIIDEEDAPNTSEEGFDFIG